MGDLRSELMRVREERGKLTPRVLVDEATAKTHPLHDRFTWDNKIAGDKWRLVEARQLLRVTFKVTNEDGHAHDLRHFLRVAPTAQGQPADWVPVEEVALDPIASAISLRAMLRAWKQFKARYGAYSEFFEMVRNDPDFLDPDEDFGDEGNGNGTEG